MTVCAVISEETSTVINLIMASPDDPSVPGYFLVANPPEHVVIGSPYPFPEAPPHRKPPDIEGVETL